MEVCESEWDREWKEESDGKEDLLGWRNEGEISGDDGEIVMEVKEKRK